MKVSNWRWALGLVATAATLGAGCAQDVGDIDRTQADKLEKSLFDNNDEWYFRQTVVDTDFQGSAGVFNALESSVKRVRWVITEDTLYAMSTVEPLEGVTDGYTNEEDRRVGIVAAFPIQGHFDIQRSYSAATGEQSNVIAENGSDREWYDRKFFRVDWSSNLADGYGMVGAQVGTMAAAVYDIPQDDDNPDPNRTRITENYIDTVNQYHFDPDIYACYYAFGLDSIYTCEGGEVKIRNAFLKMPETKTYQPLDYLDQAYLKNDDGTRVTTMRLYDPDLNSVFEMECDPAGLEFERNEFGSSPVDACSPATFDMFSRFGYFRTERVRWDEDLGGQVESNRMYYANRWNIWQTMLNEDGTVKEMQDRTPKPITYHLNVEYPLDMYESAQEVARQWDIAFKESVMLAKGTYANVTELEDELEALYGHRHMYQIVWNDCSAPMLQAYFDANGDVNGMFSELAGSGSVEDAFWGLSNQDKAQFCSTLEAKTPDYAYSGEGQPHIVGGAVNLYKSGKAFEFQRVGDLRYSYFNWVEQEVPWLGYGPSAADPVTGQLISGNANFNGTAIRTYGPIAADYIQYMNGELDDETLRLGEHMRAWLQQQQQEGRTTGQRLSPEGKRELARRSGASSSEISPTNFESAPKLEELPQFVRKLGKKGLDAEARRFSETMKLAQSSDTRAAEFYAEPSVRAMLMQDDQFRIMVESAAITKFGPEFTDDDVKSTYLDLTAPHQAVDRYKERNKLMAQRNIFSIEHMDDMISNLVTYSGVADHFQGKDRDEIGRYFVERMFVGTQLHEVGHTVGLRHNFIASTDALNYHDTYWDIQEAIADGLITDEERWSVPTDVVGQISPNGTVGQTNAPGEYLNEAEFRIASVMDYTADFTGRFAGLGKYDLAAVHFAYAEVVETWDDATMNQLTDFYDQELWLADYREIPRIMAGAGGTGLGTPEQIKAGIETIKSGRTYVPIELAKQEQLAGIRNNKDNWKAWRGELDAGGSPQPAEIYVDATVPYEFCSDDYRGSQLNCDVFDWGANQREIVNHQFQNYRLFQTFRRYNRYKINKGNESVNSYYNWVASAFDVVSTPFRYYSIYQWYDLGSYTDDLREAAIDSVNFYAEVMATPEPGRYCLHNTASSGVNTYWWYDLTDTYVPARFDRNDGRCADYIDIDRGWGQVYNYDFTNEYHYRVTRVGSFIDKEVASLALFNISASFARSSFFTDERATNISYWTLFKEETYDFLRGMILGDYAGFAGVYNPQTSSYEPPKLVDQKTFGLGLPSEQANMKRIYTPISFGHEFNVLVGAMIYNNTWQDRQSDFAQYAKVFVSTDEGFEIPVGVDVREFVHPVTNQIYRAPVANDGRSITGELVDWANILKNRFVEQQALVDAATPGTPDYQSKAEILESRSQQMEDVVAKLDMVRFVWGALGADALK